jgi:ribulose-phosphate 3-epimerase
MNNHKISTIDKLSISILDVNILKLDQSMKELKEMGIKNIHIDIIDTSFIDNISFGINTINALLEYYEFDFFIHIMIQNPILIMKRLKLANKKTKVAVHSHFEEICGFDSIIPVLSISPDESVDSFRDILPKFNEILIMTVQPGFGGQELVESCISKIEECHKLCKKVTIDGGVNINNIFKIKNADYIVVGSAFTKDKDKKKVLKDILNEMF